ncbi:tetratricopeptide repeat protein [Asticcacaulis sp. AND118]|uniref:tetratricopeptide repeat protein n=1 Tax=Asticcacaulis sp. AND118 TaxID=2840468 RepID=UPI001CFFC4E5|nr:hypothetical protein [Asticcacaulis sp. AND118]UDF05723.1 hypothetical protein LH365_17950 [Asticcacaulis sp. AND118]
MVTSRRLDGWKAIGGHFGRDRTTVMRWAQQRGLPVRRLPGGKTGTVYAFVHELDSWAAHQGDLNEASTNAADEPPQVDVTPGFWARNWRRLAVAGLMALALAFAIGNVWPRGPATTAPPALPSDPALSAMYLEARDAWAQRTPESLARALGLFEAITRKEPGFAPAWAGLADAYLLSCEFGTLPATVVFPKAKHAAQTALKHDPQLASAYRALGFVQYWWEHDPTAAGKSFRHALKLSPRDAQSHFWYGNVLVDNGQTVAGVRELNAARLIEPGNVAIQTDFAWAQWSAGDDAPARSALNGLAQSHPNFANIHDYLSVIKLADGDYVGYVQDLSEFARLVKDESLMRHCDELRAALKVGVEAVQTLLMDRAIAEIKAGTRQTHAWPVFLASVAQNRRQTLDLLEAADRRNEMWGSAGRNARIARLWMDDAEINRLLRQRKGTPVE